MPVRTTHTDRISVDLTPTVQTEKWKKETRKVVHYSYDRVMKSREGSSTQRW